METEVLNVCIENGTDIVFRQYPTNEIIYRYKIPEFTPYEPCIYTYENDIIVLSVGDIEMCYYFCRKDIMLKYIGRYESIYPIGRTVHNNWFIAADMIKGNLGFFDLFADDKYSIDISKTILYNDLDGFTNNEHPSVDFLDDMFICNVDTEQDIFKILVFDERGNILHQWYLPKIHGQLHVYNFSPR